MCVSAHSAQCAEHSATACQCNVSLNLSHLDHLATMALLDIVASGGAIVDVVVDLDYTLASNAPLEDLGRRCTHFQYLTPSHVEIFIVCLPVAQERVAGRRGER